MLITLTTSAPTHTHAPIMIIDDMATTTTITAAATATATTTTTLRNNNNKTPATIGSMSLATAATAASAAVAVPASTLHLRKRHRKRNSNWYDYYNFNENTTALEWSNPCGGFYVPTPGHQQRQRRKNQKQIYNLLKKAAGNEYRTLNRSQEDIDISNIKIWFLHEYNYKFLPKLKINSTIALKRWYRNMQTYVASFAYLRRVQLKWDRRHPKRESRTALELKHLLLSSRSMLCELETAVNHTYPVRHNGNGNGHGSNNSNNNNNGNGKIGKGGKGGKGGSMQSLQEITRTQMNKRLKLRTKRRNAAAAAASASGNGDSDSEAELYDGGADLLDLQFVKYYYYEFLKSMWKLLRQNTKRQGQIQIQQQHQQQQQQQQQQRQKRREQQRQQLQRKLRRQQKHLSAQNYRKEYNEVDKPNLAGGVAKKIRKHGKRSNRSRAQQQQHKMTTTTTTTSTTTAAAQ